MKGIIIDHYGKNDAKVILGTTDRKDNAVKQNWQPSFSSQT